MPHRRKVLKLGRTGGARKALLRGLTRALVKHGEIETSAPRAKVLRGYVDRLVSLAKKDGLVVKKRVLSKLGGDKETSQRLFRVAPLFSGRSSGFTRTIPLGTRRGDSSLRARVEWTDKGKLSLLKKQEVKTEKTEISGEKKEEKKVKRVKKGS